MSPVKVELRGLTELRQALRQLPADLTEEAGAIVLSHAEEAARQIQTAYPVGPTGHLRGGVVVEQRQSPLAATALVRSRARHAHLFERGTTFRRTDSGANRGTMPEAPINQQMIPIAIRLRGRMVQQLKALVRRAGFEVA